MQMWPLLSNTVQSESVVGVVDLLCVVRRLTNALPHEDRYGDMRWQLSAVDGERDMWWMLSTALLVERLVATGALFCQLRNGHGDSLTHATTGHVRWCRLCRSANSGRGLLDGAMLDAC
jgi:hypothetical protein